MVNKMWCNIKLKLFNIYLLVYLELKDKHIMITKITTNMVDVNFV